MKKLLCLLLLFSVLFRPSRAAAQEEEIAQLLLNVEKLAQFKSILTDMKKGYDILSGGYNTIKNISEGNFSIHKTFLDGLMEVSPAVRNYRKVSEIMNNQVLLAREYRAAFNRFKSSAIFSPGELTYMEGVYGKLLKLSMRDLDELLLIITANQMRMSDDERLRAIDRIHLDGEDKLSFLRHFNNSTVILQKQREKEKAANRTIQLLHGIDK